LLAPDASSPFAQAFGLLLDFGKAGVGVNLGMLEGSGMARVLAEPSLVTLSGQSANFLAGGEIPIPLSQGNGSVSIEYKPYGVGLTVSPTVLDDQRIVLKVAPESSELDYANAVTLQSVAVPAITTRRADTTVELGDGESFVIGGLVSQATVSSVNRVPLLSQIPVLGTLFKRQEFSRKERELVIVVTPRLVRPFAQGQLQEGQLPGPAAMAPGPPLLGQLCRPQRQQRRPAGLFGIGRGHEFCRCHDPSLLEPPPVQDAPCVCCRWGFGGGCGLAAGAHRQCHAGAALRAPSRGDEGRTDPQVVMVVVQFDARQDLEAGQAGPVAAGIPAQAVRAGHGLCQHPQGALAALRGGAQDFLDMAGAVEEQLKPFWSLSMRGSAMCWAVRRPQGQQLGKPLRCWGPGPGWG
jgi:hypothetical protein